VEKIVIKRENPKGGGGVATRGRQGKKSKGQWGFGGWNGQRKIGQKKEKRRRGDGRMEGEDK